MNIDRQVCCPSHAQLNVLPPCNPDQYFRIWLEPPSIVQGVRQNSGSAVFGKLCLQFHFGL
ncbi:hypothetical protein WS68_24230 [Burkholderia sp. TSV86]|nr:hypothetical protein WS68_24230 [Burkholderia sp. TSV86]